VRAPAESAPQTRPPSHVEEIEEIEAPTRAQWAERTAAAAAWAWARSDWPSS